MPLHVIVLGPPASGKGTQAVRLALGRGIPKISTGDILREAAKAGTALGLKAKVVMDRGEFVNDDIMVEIVRERLSRPDAKAGSILDGFPRTVAQAEALDRMMQGQPLMVINLAVPDGELIRRMRGRRVCSQCAANAEPDAESAPDSERCRRCGGRMIARADDSDETVRRHRLEVYEHESRPLLDYYKGRPTFRSIDGAQAPERVAAKVAGAIDSMTGANAGAASAGPTR